MKICFNNFFPPFSRLIAIIVCMLLLLSYTRLKAENKAGVTLNEIQFKNLNP